MSNIPDISIRSVLDNIYANVATQSLETISGGGTTRPTAYRAQILDRIQVDARKKKKSNKKKSSNIYSDNKEYANPFTYIQETHNPTAMEWIAITGLSRICTYPQRAAIIVLPSESEMRSQIREIETALKGAGLEKGKSGAIDYVTTHSFSYKNYCLNVFGSKDPTNMGYAYDVSMGNSNLLRRTGMSSGVWYLQCNGPNDIIIGTDSKLSSPSKLKLLAVCKNSVYVFGGKIPEPTEISENTKSTTLTGGAKELPSMDNYRNYFERLIKYRNNNISDAAYDFIGALGVAGIPVKDLASHYSSNYTHSAFENMFSLEHILRKKLGGDKGCDGPYCVLKSIYDNNKIDGVHESIQKIYKPRKNRISIKRAQNAINEIFQDAQHNVKNGAEANNKFISNMEQLYAKIDNVHCFKADLATSAVQYRSGPQAFQDACNLVDTLADCKNTNSIFNSEAMSGGSGSERVVRTALMNTLYDKMYSAPFIGIICKENVPLPVGFEYVKRARKSSKVSDISSLLDLYDDDVNSDSLGEDESDSGSEMSGGKKGKRKVKKCKKCKKPMSKCVCGGGGSCSCSSDTDDKKTGTVEGGGDDNIPKETCHKCGNPNGICECGGAKKSADELISLFA